QQVTTLEEDGALLIFVEPGEAIEQRCFAGPIRTDETDDLPVANIERHPIERDDATKSHAQRRDAKERYIRNRRRRCHCRHSLPADRHSSPLNRWTRFKSDARGAAALPGHGFAGDTDI